MENDVEKLRAEVKRLEAELNKLRRDHELLLRAYYFEKEKEFKDEVLPTFDELKRTSTGLINFTPSTPRPNS